MTAEQVLQFKEAAPFRPFELLLADGRSLVIDHPDFLSVSNEEELGYVYDLADGLETIDLMLVVSLRVPVRQAAGARS